MMFSASFLKPKPNAIPKAKAIPAAKATITYKIKFSNKLVFPFNLLVYDIPCTSGSA